MVAIVYHPVYDNSTHDYRSTMVKVGRTIVAVFLIVGVSTCTLNELTAGDHHSDIFRETGLFHHQVAVVFGGQSIFPTGAEHEGFCCENLISVLPRTVYAALPEALVNYLNSFIVVPVNPAGFSAEQTGRNTGLRAPPENISPSQKYVQNFTLIHPPTGPPA